MKTAPFAWFIPLGIVLTSLPAFPQSGADSEPAPAFSITSNPAVVRRVSGLIDRIRSPMNSEDRERAIEEIVDTGTPAIPTLLGEFERKNRRTWGPMVYSLGAIGDPRVIPVLRNTLGHQSGKVYMEVLYALALAGDEGALVEALKSTYASQTFEPRITAVEYIAGVMGPPALPILIREIPQRAEKSRRAGIAALGTLGDTRAVGFLIEWSNKAHPSDRGAAISALARIGALEGRQRIALALQDPDENVREAAALAAGYIRHSGTIPTLRKMAMDRRPSRLRHRTLWSLGLIGGERCARSLIGELEVARPDEISHILQALGKSRHQDAIAPLAKYSLNENPVYAQSAVHALMDMPGKDSSNALLEACHSAPVHGAGMAAAGELVKRRDPRMAPCVVQRLRRELDMRHGLGNEALELLRQLPLAASDTCAGSLRKLAEGVSAPTTQHRLLAAAQAIETAGLMGNDLDPWLKLLEKGTPQETDLAIRKLGDLRDPRAVEPLRRLLGRIDPGQAPAIPDALGRIGSDRATSFLISLLIDDIYDTPSLERVREHAAIALARYTRAPHAKNALREAFIKSKGRLFPALLAYARMAGESEVDDVVELKSLLLRQRGAERAGQHESILWAIRMLRSGREIPMETLDSLVP